MFKKGFCLLLLTVLLFAFTGCSNAVWNAAPFNKKAKTNSVEDVTIAENAALRLEWVADKAGVRLIDKATGTCWGTTPAGEKEDELDEYGMPIKKHPQAQSALIVQYLRNEDKQVDTVLSYTGAVNNGRIKSKKIKNGIRVEYYFDEVEIMIPVEYVLRSDSVSLTVKPKEIQENKNQVLNIALAPFWCSAENDAAESYLFVPSGTGSLISCQSVSPQGISYSDQVYGRDAVMRQEDQPVLKKEIRLPVFGAKWGNKATCAIVETAAESALIHASIGSTAVRYTTAYASYQVRGYTSNISQLLNSGRKETDVYAESMTTAPMTIGFYPLVNEAADYNGMAQTYKKYLKANTKLSDAENDSVLCLTFVGGGMINKSFLGLPYQDLLAATTLRDVKEILEDLSSKTDTRICARLLGFGSDGVNCKNYAGRFEISKKLGSAKDFAVLADFCNQHDIRLYMDFDLITFGNSSMGYSRFFDAAYNACYKTAYGYAYDAATRSGLSNYRFTFLSRDQLPGSADKLLKKIAKKNLPGISLSTLSNMAYSDYSGKKSTVYYAKGKMAEDVTAMMEQIGKKYPIAVSDANAYAAVLADVIFDAPTISSKERVFLYDVPFYQMVLKGHVPLSGEAINLAADEERQLLRLVETGSSMSYVVTANYHNQFIDLPYPYFYGTQYQDIGDSIVDADRRLQEYYQAIDGVEIVKHTVYENGLHETVYANGVKVYVNDSSQSVLSPLGEIPALQYVWGR